MSPREGLPEGEGEGEGAEKVDQWEGARPADGEPAGMSPQRAARRGK
jgi:hypothetical protein